MKNENILRVDNRLKLLRKTKGWKQEDVVNALKNKDVYISLKTYQNYEHNETRPPLDTLLVFADLYGCSLDYIFGRSDYMTIDNANISASTGLSETTINVLKDDTNRLSTYGCTPMRIIEMVNFICENQNDGYIAQLLRYMYEYLFGNRTHCYGMNTRQAVKHHQEYDILALMDDTNLNSNGAIITMEQLENIFLTSLTSSLSVIKHKLSTDKTLKTKYKDYGKVNGCS